MAHKTAGGQIAADRVGSITVACDAGQAITGAGYAASPPLALLMGSQPNGQSSWTMTFINIGETSPVNVTAYATCLR